MPDQGYPLGLVSLGVSLDHHRLRDSLGGRDRAGKLPRLVDELLAQVDIGACRSSGLTS